MSAAEYSQRDEEEPDREGICRLTDQAELWRYGLARAETCSRHVRPAP